MTFIDGNLAILSRLCRVIDSLGFPYSKSKIKDEWIVYTWISDPLDEKTLHRVTIEINLDEATLLFLARNFVPYTQDADVLSGLLEYNDKLEFGRFSINTKNESTSYAVVLPLIVNDNCELELSKCILAPALIEIADAIAVQICEHTANNLFIDCSDELTHAINNVFSRLEKYREKVAYRFQSTD